MPHAPPHVVDQLLGAGNELDGARLRAYLASAAPEEAMALIAAMKDRYNELAQSTQRIRRALKISTEEANRANEVLTAEVAERKRVEAIVREYNERLEETVRSRTVELEKEIEERELVEERFREANEFLRMVIDTAATAVFLVDERRYITSVNDAFCTATGLAREDVLGKHCSVLGGDPCQTHCRLLEADEHSQLVRGQCTIQAKYGRRLSIIKNTCLIRDADNEVTGAIESFVDVTELARAREAAEAMDRSKSEFLANMSHEIRTPLNAILGFSDFLRQDGEIDEEERRDCLTSIYTSGRHLLALVNDILDLSKIEAGQLEVEYLACAPHELVSEVAAVMRPQAQQKTLSLEVDFDGPLPERIVTDPTRLRQVLVNLVSNAVKFTNEGRVELHLRLQADNDKPVLLIEVEDTGIGIPPDRLEDIFNPFAQADTSITREYGGTGLGLAISRRIAESLGGTLEVTSEVGKGTVFTLRLDPGDLTDTKLVSGTEPPAADRDKQAHEPPASRELSGRVLVVDDSNTNRMLISLILKRAGLQVATVVDGKAAVEMVADESFDLILMDMQMPMMDGYTATRTMRAGGVTAPIVALTANAMKGEQEKCKAAGCSGYISKPIDVNRLIDALAALMDGQPAPTTARMSDLVEQASETPPDASPITSKLPTDDPAFREIVVEFTDRLRSQLQAMQDAWAEKDRGALTFLAHWLKGAGGTVGFPIFYNPAARLEAIAESGDLEDIRLAIDELLELSKRVTIHPPSVD